MMNPFLLPPAERLDDWKAFRRSLARETEEAQLAAVVAYFAKAPTVKLAYDLESAEPWPTIWEMIHDGNWCEQSVAIGMAETLRLSGWASKRMTLRMIIDRENHVSGLIVFVDSRWALNYNYAELVTYPVTPTQVIREWQWSGRGYADISG